MGLYELPDAPVTLALLGVLLYVGLLGLALLRRAGQAFPSLPLGLYLLLAGVTHLFYVIRALNWPVAWMGTADWPGYASLALMALLFIAFLTFVGKMRWWVWLALVAFVAVVTVTQNALFLFLAWLTLSALLGFTLIRMFLTAQQPLRRIRIGYWIPVVALAIANDISLFYMQDSLQGYLRLVGAAFLVYTIIQHHIPDARDMVRQFLIYFFTILLSTSVYLGGFLLIQEIFQRSPAYNPLLVGVAVALLVSVIYSPLLALLRGGINRIFRVQTYDPAEMLRQYSVNISNILDINKLAAASIGLLIDSMEIKSGLLFLVDPELDEETGSKVYRLSGIRGDGLGAPIAGKLTDQSLVVNFFTTERKPLLQYDVDFAPAFMNTPLPERKWLSGLGVDVFVPIISKDEWIGLFALAPKVSGRRYTDEDLGLLSTIASQTGVALENARLVENLKKLNNQIREAYAFLDKANRDLANLENTKSNFISIASHELRTPLTVAKAYTEMLLENDTLDSAILDVLKGIHKSTLRQIEIMDSMFDIAQIDTRSIELHRQDVFLTELIRSVAQEKARIAAERKQELALDLPQLPSISADPNALRKLFHHLLMNAIKFTPDAGIITITGKQVPANNRDLPEGGVEIIISDTGVGIDQSFQEVIFTKFYQPGELLNRHSTGKSKFKGSGMGLGLSLSRGIVEVHGGRIWVESEGYDEEKFPGSHFHVILPFRAQSESKTVRMGSAVKLKL